MPAPVSIGDIMHYRCLMKNAGQLNMFSTYLVITTAQAVTDYVFWCQNMLQGAELGGGIIQLSRPLAQLQIAFTQHAFQRVSPARQVAVGVVPGGGPDPINGSRAGTKLPPNVSTAVTRRTLDGTRHGLGTLKPPFGTVEDTNLDGTWKGPFLADLKLWGDRMATTFTGVTVGNSAVPVIWSSGPGFPTTAFIGSTVNNAIRVNHRRTVGVGV